MALVTKNYQHQLCLTLLSYSFQFKTDHLIQGSEFNGPQGLFESLRDLYRCDLLLTGMRNRNENWHHSSSEGKAKIHVGTE